MNTIARNLKRINNSRSLFVVLLVLIIVAFYVLNYYTTYIADDYNYKFVFGIDESVRVSSFKDLVASQIKHYNTNGGRWVAHTFAQLLLIPEKGFFNYLHSAVYLGYVLLLYLIVKREIKYDSLLLVTCPILIWLFSPRWGQVFLWLTGSCNYYYTMLPVILIILFLKKVCCDNCSIRPALKAVLIVCSFLGGASNELMGGLYIFLLIGLLVFGGYSKPVKQFVIVLLVAAIFGYLSLLCAPGNFRRFFGDGMGTTSIVALLSKLSKNLIRNIYMSIMNVLGAICLFTVSVYYAHYHCEDKRVVRFSLIMGCSAILSLFILTIAEGGFSERSATGAVVILVIAAVLCITHSDFAFDKVAKGCCAIVVCAGCLFTTVQYVQTVIDTRKIYIKNEQREEYIEHEVAKGNHSIVYPQIKATYPHVAMYGLEDIRYDTGNGWPNTWIARYYGLDSIYAVTQYQFDKLSK